MFALQATDEPVIKKRF